MSTRILYSKKIKFEKKKILEYLKSQLSFNTMDIILFAVQCAILGMYQYQASDMSLHLLIKQYLHIFQKTVPKIIYVAFV